MKKFLALLIALAMVFALCACGQQQAAPAASSGDDAYEPSSQTSVEFGEDAQATNENATVTEKPAGIQPGTTFSYWTNYDVPLYCPWIDNRASAFLWQVYDNLVCRYHSNVNDIRPCLAESWDVDNEEAPTNYVFHLRQDAYFSDGEQVTAQAFVNTWDKATREYQPRMFTNVDYYKAIDDFTLEIQLTAPQSSFMNELVCAPHCAPVSIAALDQYGVEDNGSAVGVGPYVVDTYTPGEGFVLKANTNYYNELKQPSIETVRMVLIPEENTALLALQNDELDCMNFVSIQTYEVLEAAGWNILKIKDRCNPFWMNPSVNPIFKNDAVREALCHMIDWNEVNELAYNGLYGVPNSYYDGAGSYPYDDSYDYDPELGLQILADAGIKPEDVKFTMLADPDFTTIETVLTQMFNDLGLVNVGFETLDGLACYGMLKAGTYEVFPCHNGYSEESCLTPYTMGLAGTDHVTQPVLFLNEVSDEAFAEAQDYYAKAIQSGTFEEYVENVSNITRIAQENHMAFGGLCVTRFYAVNPEISGIYPCQIGGYVEFCYMYSNVG